MSKEPDKKTVDMPLPVRSLAAVVGLVLLFLGLAVGLWSSAVDLANRRRRGCFGRDEH
jgi:hypothetical protein